MCSKMCTQKAFRSNPLSMASCDLSFTFPQQRKKKQTKTTPKICGEILPSPRDTVQNFIIQEKWNCFKHFPILTITDCSRGLQNSPGMNLRGPAATRQLDRCAAAFPFHVIPPQPCTQQEDSRVCPQTASLNYLSPCATRGIVPSPGIELLRASLCQSDSSYLT